jgi:DNA-binding MarR family transcriptional regulator
MYLVYSLSRQYGWCWASKRTLAQTLNLTEPTIYNLIKKLVLKGYLDRAALNFKNKKRALLKPTDQWENYMKELGEVDI